MALTRPELDALMAPGEPPPSVLDLIRRPAWMREAACRGTDVSVFFPALGQGAERARELCERCPVRQPCGDYALSDPDLDGWWAGTSARQRVALRRKAS